MWPIALYFDYTRVLLAEFRLKGFLESLQNQNQTIADLESTIDDAIKEIGDDEEIINRLKEIKSCLETQKDSCGAMQEIISKLGKDIDLSKDVDDIQEKLGEVLTNHIKYDGIISKDAQFNQKDDDAIDAIRKLSELITDQRKILLGGNSVFKCDGGAGKKCRYWEYILVPGIVAIALILSVILHPNFTSDKCAICWSQIVSYLIILLTITLFALFCFMWRKAIEKSHQKADEKILDQELQQRNNLAKKEFDFWDLQISLLQHKIEHKEQYDKVILDEYVRDKEHIRKIELKNQENYHNYRMKHLEVLTNVVLKKQECDKSTNNGSENCTQVVKVQVASCPNNTCHCCYLGHCSRCGQSNCCCKCRKG